MPKIKPNPDIVRRVLSEAKKHGVKLTADGAMFRLADNRLVRVRTAQISGEKSEHSMSFERFKVSPNIQRVAFVIFAIESAGDLVTYIFRPSEIVNLKSLNLRYSDVSKYQMKRKSKYDSSRENWKKLRSGH